MKVNQIQGLHAIIQELIDQGRMPIPDVIQKYLGNSDVAEPPSINQVLGDLGSTFNKLLKMKEALTKKRSSK